MTTDIPYMMQMGNIPKIFSRIREAGTPPKFTHEFLKNTLGFTGSGDRGIIKVLKAMGFLSNDSAPTERYNRFKGPTGATEIARGLREGWGPVFLADQRANDKTKAQLTQIFKSVTGAGEASAVKMASTFKAIADLADWSDIEGLTSGAQVNGTEPSSDAGAGGEGELREASPQPASAVSPHGLSLRHDIHVHLPATSDVTVYTAIFRAIRDELRD